MSICIILLLISWQFWVFFIYLKLYITKREQCKLNYLFFFTHVQIENLFNMEVQSFKRISILNNHLNRLENQSIISECSSQNKENQMETLKMQR